MAAGDRYAILAEFQPWDPVTAAAVTVRACSVDDARVTALNGTAWQPGLVPGRRSLDLFDGAFGGKIVAGIGDLEINLASFPNAARYAWGERPVTLWRGLVGAAWGSYTQIFAGLTRPPRAAAGRMRIGLRVDDRWLDKPLLATYAGTGGAEGPADLKGVPKPLALGAPQFIEGVIVNRTKNIVQLHGYGAMNAVSTALDRLNRYGAAAGNDANYAALDAATIAPGAWRTCTAEGLVRFGAPPGGVLSFLAQGDSGSALGWVRKPGEVIRRIALIAGASAGQIDTASLAALDAALPYNISLYLKEQTTAREVIQSIAASCNAAAGVSWLGKLFVARAVIGTPAYTLATDGSSLPPTGAVELLESSAPFWRIGLEAARTERVHSSGEYGAIGAADLAYADGTTVEALKPAAIGADVTAAQTIVSKLSATTGNALDNFVASDGIPFSRVVASGEARDGDAVSFPVTYGSVPQVTFSYGGNAATAGQNIKMQADALTASGFTMRAKSQAVTVGSTITDTGSSTGSGGEPPRVMNRTNSGAPFDGRFVFTYTVTVGNIAPGEPGTITVGIYCKIGGSWVEVGTADHGASGTYSAAVTPGTVDFGAGNEFGVGATYTEGSGTAVTAFGSVVYQLGTVTETSLTPSGSSPIKWEARL